MATILGIVALSQSVSPPRRHSFLRIPSVGNAASSVISNVSMHLPPVFGPCSFKTMWGRLSSIGYFPSTVVCKVGVQPAPAQRTFAPFSAYDLGVGVARRPHRDLNFFGLWIWFHVIVPSYPDFSTQTADLSDNIINIAHSVKRILQLVSSSGYVGRWKRIIASSPMCA